MSGRSSAIVQPGLPVREERRGRGAPGDERAELIPADLDIKDPTQDIVWIAPEGGGGPTIGYVKARVPFGMCGRRDARTDFFTTGSAAGDCDWRPIPAPYRTRISSVRKKASGCTWKERIALPRAAVSCGPAGAGQSDGRLTGAGDIAGGLREPLYGARERARLSAACRQDRSRGDHHAGSSIARRNLSGVGV